MKKIQIGYLICSLLIFIANATAQNLSIVAKIDTSSVTLRWMPLDYSTWKKGNIVGYDLYRTTAGQDKKVAVLLNNIPLQCLPETYWANYTKTNKQAGLIPKLIAEEPTETQSQDLIFALAMLQSNLAVGISAGLGLLFEDKTALRNQKYDYEVRLHDTDIRANIIVTTNTKTILTAPKALTGSYADSTVFLRWLVADSVLHSAFVVERSDDGGRSYKSVQPEPILATAEADSIGNYFGSKVLKVGRLHQHYYYRVKAITPFGQLSEPSAVLQIYAYQDHIPQPVVKHRTGKFGVELKWSFPENLQDDIKGFEVQRSSKLGGTYTKLNTTRLPRKQRIYIDSLPLSEAYYQVSVLNWINKPIASYPEFVQVPDSIPPSKPVFKYFPVDSLGIVRLSWRANKELDLEGYSLFRGDSKKREFSLLSKQMNKDSILTDTLALNVLNKNIYYTLIAYDYRLNASIHSDTILVKRPDIIPPSPPAFTKFVLTDTSIVFTWANSPSEDLLETKLYRRAIQDSLPVLLQSYSFSNKIAYYADTTAIEKQEYEYSLVAIDDANLRSEPAKIRLERLFTGVRKPINPILVNYNTDTPSIELSWQAPARRVNKYILYRQRGETEKMLMYKYFSSDKPAFIDSNIIPDQIYRYRLMAIFDDKSESKLSAVYTAILNNLEK